MPAQALAVIATLASFAQSGNRVAMELDHGSAELVWISPASFHFRRSLDGVLAPARPEAANAAVTFQSNDTADAVEFRSNRIIVTIRKRGVLLSVRRADGVPLMVDVSEPRPDGGLVTWDREMLSGARYFGLGGSSDTEFDLRGKALDSPIPFLISSAGFGEFHNGTGAFHFDFTATGRYRIDAPQVDYYFYSGRTPKEIFEEHKGVVDFPFPPPQPPPANWDGLRSALLAAVHQAASSKTLPRFNLAAYAGAPQDLLQRARQIGSLLPVVNAGVVPLSTFRQQLNTFYDIYEIETRDRGFPIWHALPFQFPDDPECARHADEFMLGDEMLIAPIYQSANKREVYLPPGNWTNLETNQEFAGRATIPVDTAALPVFAKNGSILPLDSGGGIGLHYFPKSGGEFFILERETGDYTQVHAAPAADVMRLEIESKKERTYQWVIHHVEQPVGIGFEDQKYQSVTAVADLKDRTWFYDAAAKTLIVKVRVKAGEDNIINLSW